MKSLAVVPGSLSAITGQNGNSLAQSFLSVDAILVVDTSGSMGSADAPGNRRRYDAACDELRTLQANLPGKIAVVAFSDRVEFCPTGVPTYFKGGTNMSAALRFVQIADGLGIRIIVISDGLPDNPATVLDIAREFTSRIDTIYMGPETGWEAEEGRKFLQELSQATGGVSGVTTAPGMLAAPVTLLLEASI